MHVVKTWILPFAFVLGASLLVAWLAGASLVAVLMVLGAGVAVFAWHVPGGDRLPVLRSARTQVVLRSLAGRIPVLLFLTTLVTLVVLPLEEQRGRYRGIFDSTVIWWVSGVVIAWGLMRFQQVQGAWSKVIPPAIGAMALMYGLWLMAGSSLSHIGESRYGDYVWNGWAYLWWGLVVVAAGGLFHMVVETAQLEHARQQAVAQAGAQPMTASPGRGYAPVPGPPVDQPMHVQPVGQQQRRPVAPVPHAPAVAKAEVPALAIGQIPEHLFGQDRAVAAWTELLAQYIPYYQAGVVTRPLAVVQAGPVGVGKHYCVELLAKGPLRGLDVRLIDVPENGVIAPDILNAIAEGGDSVKRTVFIACVNDPGGAISDLLASADEVTQDRLTECLSARIDKQTLRRFTRILPFAALDPTACAQIAGNHLVELADRNDIVIERLDPQFLYRCAQLGTASVLETGARAIQLEVPKLLGDGLERCKLHRAAAVDIGMAEDDVVELRITATLS